ncbi:MAG: GatB/YqeY domain-containing protein [Desulfobacteraceae bacterium]|nr:GatB/YqeY domain-containing protein [Desulfobacteraceae bacterium]
MNREQYGWGPDTGLPLLAKMREDLKSAMRSQDSVVKDTIRIIMAEFPKLTVPITLESGKKSTRPKKQEEITDDEIIGIIQGLVKSEKQTLELTGGTTSEYLEILKSYLPRQASREEIEAWVRANVDFSQYKSPMQAMGSIMKHFGKTADGNLVRDVLQKMQNA